LIGVIQAGGKGTRLQPYTFVMPKPLMPIGDQPVLEILLKWLRRWGIKDIIITTGYLGHLIHNLCNSQFNGNSSLKISFNQEPEPLGTVGGLKLLTKQLSSTFVCMNGDLITDLNLMEFIEFHKKEKKLLTVAVTTKKMNIDLGVLECGKGIITSFREKPTMEFSVSMGIYCMEPEIIELIPSGIPFGFDNLVSEMMNQKLPIQVYKHDGLWMDIGREEDFKIAQTSFLKENKAIVLGC